jgi:Protein of unknown function (DUF2380)
MHLTPCAVGVSMLVMSWGAMPGAAAERIVLFDVEFINSSLEPVRPDEEARIAMISGLLREGFAERDGFEVLNEATLAEEVGRIGYLRGCNGCELKMAARIDADLAGLGWVQKVSNLILNINLQVREVTTGRLVYAGTVDIRGNTDESWRRGVRYLLERRIFRQ